MQRLLLGALICTAAAQAATFYAAGFDQTTLRYNQLVSIGDSSPTVTPLGTLGDGSLNFAGGLAVGPGGVLYGIGNVPFGGSDSLYRIQPDGTITLAGSLPVGIDHFTSLTYDPANGLFYGMVDGFDPQTLYSIQLNGAGMVGSVSVVEPGFAFRGIAYNTANGTFWGISDNDVLWQFNLSGGATIMGVSQAFGNDFNGLVYDPVNNAFWTLETPTPLLFHQTGLIQISPAGVNSPNYSLSQMFNQSSLTGLTIAPDAPSRTDAPEPAISVTIGAGLALIGLARLRRNRRL
jgi:hypothetical protein